MANNNKINAAANRRKIYSRFSRELLYNQTGGNIVSVRNYPDSSLSATEHALLALTLDDFYSARNNASFCTYSNTMFTEGTKVCCS